MFVQHRASSAALGLTVMLMVLLSGCSGEPSSGDIAQAIDRQLEEAYRQGVAAAQADPRGMAADMLKGVSEQKFKGQIHDLKKLACSKGETAVNYTCQVEIDRTMPIIGERMKRTEQVKLIKGSDGWKLVQ